MRTLVRLLLVLLFFAASAVGDDRPGPGEVVVRDLGSKLPYWSFMRSRYLWKQFVNAPDEAKFISYETDGWMDNYSIFADALTRKARSNGLDATSLGKVLEVILQGADGLALLPVGAYQVTLKGEPVWIVVVNWERVSPNHSFFLAHVRVFAYDQKTLGLVGFVTCD